jgi:hypothetical protein
MRAFAVLVASALFGCHSAVCGGSEAAASKTPAEEALAFERVWKHCRPLSLSAKASDGSDVSFSDPALTKKIHRVRISSGARSFEHTLIAPDNVLLLLRE